MFASLISFSVLAFVSYAAGSAPSVQIGSTTFVGTNSTPPGQDFFGGIKFAQAPVGPLRFKPPVPIGKLNVTTFDASQPGEACIQTDLPTSVSTEDCLSLNIFRPSGTAPDAKLPVMVWIFPGGFFQGNGGWYNGSDLVAQSVIRGTPTIYVSINYRLGPLGFPQGAEAAANGALNLGLKDQYLAFEWLQENINLFGGCKEKVTIFGQSAGSISVGVHYLNPNLGQVARAAIMQSGTAATGRILNATVTDRAQDWQNFVAAVPQCASVAASSDTLDCMRGNLTSDVLLSAMQAAYGEAPEGSPFGPTIDGPGGIYPDYPSRIWATGRYAKIPLLAGDVLDEGTEFVPQSTNSTQEIYDGIIAMFSPNQVGANQLANATEQLLSLYPDDASLGSPYNTGNDTFGLSSQYKRYASLYNDLMFHSLRRLWLQTASKAGMKVFGYLFSDSQLFTTPAVDGVNHSSDVSYVFSWLSPSSTPSQTLTLESIMIDYWLSFATSLTPNDGLGSQRPTWEQYTTHNQVLMQLDGLNTTMIPDTYRAAGISFINSNPLLFNH